MIENASLPKKDFHQQDIMNSFLTVDNHKFQLIDRRNLKDKLERSIPNVKTNFVMGVLATIERVDDKEQAIDIICKVASHMLFNKEVEFKFMGQWK